MNKENIDKCNLGFNFVVMFNSLPFHKLCAWT